MQPTGLVFGALALSAAALGTHATEPEVAESAQFSARTSIIAIDGRLDDDAWRSAAPVTRFFEVYPGNASDPAVRTEARFVYDEQYVYVGVTAFDSDPGKIRSGLVRRDNVTKDQDYVEIYLDSLNGRRGALVFKTNPHGVPNDAQFNEETRVLDARPDFNFDVQASVSNHGWEAEFRIPLATLRYRADRDQSWYFAVLRNRPRDSAMTIASIPRPRAAACLLCFAGQLHGISIDARAPPVFVTPHVTYAHADTHELNGGVDGKWLARPNTVVDATLLPDFSQVEADDLQLTANARFTLALKEKRPFFLEGMDLISMPMLAVQTRAFADPQAGLRITHRGEKSDYTALWLRDQGGGIVLDPGPLSSSAAVQSAASNAVFGRYKREVGNLMWGAVGSLRLVDDGSCNQLFGFDASWAPGAADRFAAQILLSDTRNPDRPEALPTWDGRALTGSAYSLTWEHASDRWYSSVAHDSYSNGFRAWNGFVPQVNVSTSSAATGLTFYPHNAWFVRISPGVSYTRTRQLDGGELSADWAPNISFSMPRQTELTLSWHPAARDLTIAGVRTYDYMSLDLTTTPAAWLPQVRLTALLGRGIDYETGDVNDARSIVASAPLRLGSRLELKGSLGYLEQRGGPTGDKVFSQNNQQLHALWHFSSKLYLQALYQRSMFVQGPRDNNVAASRFDNSTFSGLLSYQANWQTRYFIGFRRNSSASAVSGESQVFAKFSYVLSRWQ